MNAAFQPRDLFSKHRERFDRAQLACAERHHWSPFSETPATYPNADEARKAGLQAFNALQDAVFEIDQPGIEGLSGSEQSPYTRKLLGIRYPKSALGPLFDAAECAMDDWSRACPESRLGVLLEVIDRIYSQHVFTLSYAVMHTTGQSFNMSYTGSGVNALDRGLEALVYAYQAMKAVTLRADWTRQFGSSTVALEKTYRLVPKGVAVCFACASFPTWNALPSMMASLATGNPVIVKAHPATILPMALVVRIFRQCIADAGFDPNLVTLALDTPDAPIGKEIIKHPKTAIVDFTGSVGFGRWVETNAHPAISYTETAGCNTVVLAEVQDLDEVLRSLATTLCMFSAQMCTSPQNIYVPRAGVSTPDGLVPVEVVGRKLADAITAIAQNPKRAGMILACIQSEETLGLLRDMQDTGSKVGKVLLQSGPYVHPEFPEARTATPLMLQVTPSERELYSAERFGPVSFLITCDSADDALNRATADVRECGGLTAFLYALDEDFIQRAERKYARAGAQLTINLTGPMPLNFAAAYSDYHVTGLNPAGNASLTDSSFIAGRFRIAQSRRPHGTSL